MELTCYLHEGWEPRIRPATKQRAWMEETPNQFAYRCLPLAIANAHGWEILSPCGFEACWNGGMSPQSVEIRPDPGAKPHQVPVPLFGAGTLTFHVEGIFRTPEGWNLWIGGPPNEAKDGIAPLGGVIETDWSPYTFTMNWRFTRAGKWVRFEENEPFCFLFPVQRGALTAFEPRLKPMAEAPELLHAFKTWSASRDAFTEQMKKHPPRSPADSWQKLYYRGVDPHGEPGPDDHESKLRVAQFRDGQGKPLVIPDACPVTAARAAPAQPQPVKAAIAGQPPQRPDPMLSRNGGKAPNGAPLAGMPGGNGQLSLLAKPSPLTAGAMAADNVSRALRQIGFDAPPAARPQPGLTAIALNQAAAAKPAPAKAAEPARPDVHHARRDWILEVNERQRALSPRTGAVARVRNLSSDEFLDRYYAPGRPVVIEGAMAGWPALDWTPEAMAAKVGKSVVEYQGGRKDNPNYELDKRRHQRRMPFDDYIKLITDPASPNDAYITAFNNQNNVAALAPLQADMGHLDSYLTRAPGLMWVGPGGTFTPLHFDLTNNLLAQLVGRKQLVLIPPSETPNMANHRHVFSEIHDITDPARLASYPAAATVRRFEVTIGPGDLLYVPIGWWHQVRSLEFSVMLTYTNFLWPNDFFQSFPND